jgi:hypothetical protein
VNIFTKDRTTQESEPKAEVTSTTNVFKSERKSSHKVDLSALDFKQLSKKDESKPADIIKYVNMVADEPMSQFVDTELESLIK